MYKDEDRQRQAVKEAVRRFRAKNRDSAVSGQKQALENAPDCPVLDKVCNTRLVIPPNVIPKVVRPVIPGHRVGELTKARQTSRKGFNK